MIEDKIISSPIECIKLMTARIDILSKRLEQVEKDIDHLMGEYPRQK